MNDIDRQNIAIFTDGSSRGNPGPGGWGAIVINDGKVKELGGHEDMTTNNRMELTAAIKGLDEARFFIMGIETVKMSNLSLPTQVSIFVYSDSSYVINGITKWVEGWKRKGWKTSQKEPVQNQELWKTLVDTIDQLKNKSGDINVDLLWRYVGGHVGIAGNERCDEIATMFADKNTPNLFSGARADYSIKDILNIDVANGVGDIDGVSIQKQAEKKAKKAHSKAAAYSYVSIVNGVVQTHATWAECEARVKGTSGAKFKKALSREEEGIIQQEFYQNFIRS